MKKKEINLCQKSSTGFVQLNNGLKTFRACRRLKQNKRMCETHNKRMQSDQQIATRFADRCCRAL